MLDFNQFLIKYNGQTKVGNTPENTGECVGLVSIWQDNLGVPHEFGHAMDLLVNADKKYFDVIPNTPTGVPDRGDIVVWKKAFNGTFGHTAIATGSGDTFTFEVFEQNNPIGSNCHLKRYNYNYVDGWLHFKQTNPDDSDALKQCLLMHDQLVNEAIAKDAKIKEMQVKQDQLQFQITTLLGDNKKLEANWRALQDEINQIKAIVNK